MAEKELLVRIIGDDRDLQRALARTDRSLSQIDNRTAQFGSNVKRAFAAFGITVGVASFSRGVGRVIQSATEFEEAFAGVRKTVDATESEFAELEAGFRGLAKEIPLTAVELAGIGESAGQLGVAKEDILDFTRTVADLSATTDLTSQTAADAFARLTNITGLPQDQIDKLGSTVVDLGNKLAATESEIIDFALRIAGAGKQAGLTDAQIVAIAGAFRSVGIESEAGGTAVQKVLLSMTSAALSGGKQLEAFARVAGTSAEGFRRAFQRDSGAAFVEFVEGLERIREEGGNVFKTLDALGFADQRLVRAFLSMSSNSQLLADSLQIGSTAFEQNSALAEEAGKRYQTTASQIQIAKNNLNDLAISAGNVLLPVIQGLARDANTLGIGIRFVGDALSSDDFKEANASFSELTERFAELEDSVGSFAPGAMQELAPQIREIATELERLGAINKVLSGFKQASPQIREALEDGIVTPLEQAQLETTELGRLFLELAPGSVLTGLGASIRSGLEDATASARVGVEDLGAEIRSGIEDMSRDAVVSARQGGKNIGDAIADGLADSAARVQGQLAGLGEQVLRAQISGSTGAELSALRDSEAKIREAIDLQEQIIARGKAGAATARKTVRTQLLPELLAVITSIDSVLAEQKQSLDETARKAEDRARDSQEKFNDLLDALNLDLSVAQTTKPFADDLAALDALEDAIRKRIAKEGESTELLRELFAVREEQRRVAEQLAEQRRERRKQQQFLDLGLTEEGDRPTPGAGSLLRRTKNLQEQIKGTVLDTEKTRQQLARIASVLKQNFRNLGKEVRQAILDMLNDISGALDEDGSKKSGEITRGGIRSTQRLLRGLDLTDEERRILTQRNLGRTGRRGLSAFGFGIGGASTATSFGRDAGFGGGLAGAMIINGPITVVTNDPNDLMKKLQKKGRRSSGGRRGRHGGANLGLQ